jgi:autotransporter-associated beta strand protein
MTSKLHLNLTMKIRILATTRSFSCITLILALVFGAATAAQAASGTWNVNAAGNWSAAANWSPTAVPGTAAGDVVGLTFDITAARTVTIDTTSRTVGTLNIGDPATAFFAYTLAASGGAKLAFDNSGNGASLVQAVTTASDVISAPLILADNLSINNSSTLTLSGIISDGGTGKTITKAGAGALTLSGANTYTGKTTISAGTVSFNSIGNIGAASSALGAPTTVEDGTIDLATTLTYTGPAAASDRVINFTGGVVVNNSGTGLLTLNGGITGGNSQIIFRGAQNITETGVVATGGGAFLHTDGGTLTLSNTNNSFSGALGPLVGTISVNSVSDAGTPSAIGQGGSINFGQAGFTGIGKLQFTGINGGSCNRAISVNSPSGTASGGIIENTVAGQTLTLSGDIGTGGQGPSPQLMLVGVGNGELSGTIGGSGLAIIMAGTNNTWTLSGANYGSGSNIVNSGVLILSGGNYGTGTTIVNSGVLKVNNPDALGTAGSAPVTANGGQLDFNSISPNFGGLSGTSGGLITNSSTTPVTLTLNNYGTSANIYAGRINDNGAGNAISIYNGAGVQELTGTNNYSGTSTVAGGTLAFGTVGAATNSPITVNDGATLGVVVTAVGTTFTPANLTMGSGGGATINCFLGKLGTPTAPLIAPGTLAVNGTLTFSVNPDCMNLTPGQPFTLLKHPSAASIPTALGTLPALAVAHLVTNVPNSSIDLVFDCISGTIWVGDKGSDWDINGTANWTNSCAASSITYVESSVPGAAVTFDDAAVTHFVNLTTTLSPALITVSNSVLNYTFSGAGTIAGPGALTKSGSAMLTIASDNSFTGGTLINSGTINLGNGGATGNLGTGSITDNGTLVMNRSSATTFSQLITGSGSVVIAGPGTNTLTGANTYSGGTTFSAGTLGIGVASVNSGRNIVSGATGVGNVTLADGVTLADSGNRWDAATVTLQGDITLLGNTRQQITFKTLDLAGGTRRIHLNATGGNVVQSIPGNTALETTGRDRWEFNDLTDTNAALIPITVTNGNLILDSSLTGTSYAGFMFQHPSSFAGNVGLTVGTNVYLQSWQEGGLGSNTTDTARLTVYGVWILDGSLPTSIFATNHWIYSLAGSGRAYASVVATSVSPRKIWLLGTAGTTEFSGVLADGPGTGKLSLVKTGGSTQILSGVNPYSGNTTISGGMLTLAGSGSIGSSTVISVGSGSTLDVAGRTDQTLTLNNGQTLAGDGSINGNLVTLAGSTVNPGAPVGTLRVTNNITLGGTLLFELNRTNAQTCDQLVSVLGTITYGGMLSVTNSGPALKAGDMFQLFPAAVTAFSSIQLATNDATGSFYTWTNKIAVDGSIQVLTAVYPVNKTPTNFTASASGNQLVLSWPTDHVGWHLQVQTNPPATGLSTNWVTIPNTDLSNGYTNTVDPTQGSVFYRMVYP